jgi:hypothetical protein
VCRIVKIFELRGMGMVSMRFTVNLMLILCKFCRVLIAKYCLFDGHFNAYLLCICCKSIH